VLACRDVFLGKWMGGWVRVPVCVYVCVCVCLVSTNIAELGSCCLVTICVCGGGRGVVLLRLSVSANKPESLMRVAVS